MLKVWILSLFVSGTSSGVASVQYTFLTQKECLAASAWHVKVLPNVRSSSCYWSYIPKGAK